MVSDVNLERLSVDNAIVYSESLITMTIQKVDLQNANLSVFDAINVIPPELDFNDTDSVGVTVNIIRCFINLSDPDWLKY